MNTNETQKPEMSQISFKIPTDLKNRVPATANLTKYIIEALREKLEREGR